ncbi:MAG: thermonuclease family protein [Planctomycetia bacterium]
MLSAMVLATVGGLAGAASPEPPVTWRVVGVSDGDTLTALDENNTKHKVRLHGIDAPEIGQPFGTKSREALGRLTVRKTATLHLKGRDRYGRDLARVEVDGHDVNLALVKDGLAWHYVRYDQSPELAAAEREAREAKRGVWADTESVPPWEWRATERDRKSQPAGR